jgi:hypothetical protein
VDQRENDPAEPVGAGSRMLGLDLNSNLEGQPNPIPADLNQIVEQEGAISMKIDFNPSGITKEEVYSQNPTIDVVVKEPVIVVALHVEPVNFLHLELQPHELNALDLFLHHELQPHELNALDVQEDAGQELDDNAREAIALAASSDNSQLAQSPYEQLDQSLIEAS